MKKLTTLLLVLTLCVSALFTVGCGEKKDDRPVLRVGMECAYQPYNWTQFDDSNGAVPIYGKSGQYANGYDVKIAKRIADALDMRLEVHAYEWGSLIAGVQAGALDMIIAGMSPTDERKQEIDFSVPYLTSDLVIVVRKDGAYASASSLADFAGAKIAAQMGTFHDTVIDQIANVQHQTALSSFTALRVALDSKAIDGYIAEESGAIADCNSNSAFTYVHLINNQNGFTVTDLSNVTIAVGVKKGSALLEGINAAINAISDEEKLQLMTQAIEQAE